MNAVIGALPCPSSQAVGVTDIPAALLAVGFQARDRDRHSLGQWATVQMNIPLTQTLIGAIAGTLREATTKREWRDIGCSLLRSLLIHQLVRARREGGELMS